MSRKILALVTISFALAVSACTTIGFDDARSLRDAGFGEREELRVCIYADDGISEDDAHRLIGSVNEEFAAFALEIKVPWVRSWKRTAFFSDEIYKEIGEKPLEPPCDRQLTLVGRHFGDFLFGFLGVEKLGAVDLSSHTRGFVVAERASLNQLILSPTHVAIHEFYHLLGCRHGTSLAECYPHIRRLKAAARANRENGNDFFPGASWDGYLISSREKADALAHEALKSSRLASSAESGEAAF